MNTKRWSGRVLSEGKVKAPIIIVNDYVSFYGDVNPEKGTIKINNEEKLIKDKILIIKGGKGSTVGSYIIYQMKKNEVAPLAILCINAEPIIVTGCVLAEIPLLDQINEEIITTLNDGDIVKIEHNMIQLVD
jgi:hypothetical protein